MKLSVLTMFQNGILGGKFPGFPGPSTCEEGSRETSILSTQCAFCLRNTYVAFSIVFSCFCGKNEELLQFFLYRDWSGVGGQSTPWNLKIT